MFSKLEKSVKTTRVCRERNRHGKEIARAAFHGKCRVRSLRKFCDADGDERACHFAHHSSPHCDGERNGGLLPHMDLIEQPDRADTGDLLCELCESRDAVFFCP